MKLNWKTHVAVAGLALVPVVAWSALAPAPFSTGPTPIGSLPFTITDPGTYCLTGNLTAGAGVAGIDVVSADVVIDLGGFRLDGGGDSDGSGIRTVRRNVTVQNGTVTGWGNFGIELDQEATVRDVQVRSEGTGAIRVGSRSLVERATTRSTTGAGIFVQGEASVVDRCRVVITEDEGDVSSGIRAVGASTILHSQVRGGSTGIGGGNRTRVLGCHAEDFLQVGISVSNDSVVKECSTISFTTYSGPGASIGILATGSTVIEDCSVSGSVEIGIEAGQRSQVVRCEVTDTRGSGIRSTSGGRVVDCQVDRANQEALAGSAGIRFSSKGRVEGCTVRSSQGPGILFEMGLGRVERCDVEGGTGDGIVVQSDVHLSRNRVFDNVGAGIRVLGDRCVLLENVVDRNDDGGIVVDGRTNHLERNLAAFNKGGDYDLEWGNPFGKIERPSGQMTTFESQTNYETPFGF
jgi:hypothetical protein